MLNSKAKGKYILTSVDERLLSSKLASLNKSEIRESNEYSKFFTDSNKREDPTIKILKALAMKYDKKLRAGIEISYSDIEKDIYTYGLKDYSRWIQNFKAYLVNETLRNIIDDHHSNINSLNNAMSKSLGISIVNTMTDNSLENEPLMYREWTNLISSNSLDFTQKADDLLGEYNTRFKIFFGDNEKISTIKEMIAKRLDTIKILNNKNKQSIKENKNENKDDNYSLLFPEGDFRRNSKININNPFSNKDNKSSLLSQYKERFNQQSQYIERNLENIYKLLNYRLELNKSIFPLFSKVESRQHSQLIRY